MASAQRTNVLSLAFSRYLHHLHARPLRTKALTSSAIAGLSDVIAQGIIRGGLGFQYNWRRTLAIMLYGFFWNGPSGHFWQHAMEVLFRNHPSNIITVLKKVIIDQTTYGPLCNILFMSYATVVLEGKSLRVLSTKVRSDYPLVQLNGWKVWPLAALINYTFVPLQFRVLFVNMVALCWSIFLLLRARKLAVAAAKERAKERDQGERGGGPRAKEGGERGAGAGRGKELERVVHHPHADPSLMKKEKREKDAGLKAGAGKTGVGEGGHSHSLAGAAAGKGGDDEVPASVHKSE